MLRTKSLSIGVYWLLSLGLSGLLLGCSSDEKKADTPEGAFALAQEFDNEERYEEAITRYQEVKNKFPYSRYATMAELAVADVYFKQESFPEAQASYQLFKELHPKHPQIDYVTFRLALSYYKQLPETIDRDLSLAPNAIAICDEVIAQYPNSPHAQESKDKRAEVIKKMAAKEDYIANFYFIRQKWDSALGRYEGLMKTYPNLGFDAQALSRAAISANKLGELEKSKKYLSELKNKFPQSSELESAQKEIR